MNPQSNPLQPAGSILNQLLASPGIWRGRNAVAVPQTIACGYPALAGLLCGGGWQVGVNTEVLLPQAGIGELQMLMPALQALHQKKQWIALVEPPYIPYLPAWIALGLTPSRLLWVRATALPKRLWAIEQLLRSGSCGAVLSWLPDAKLMDRDIRRLQQAAAVGSSVHVLFRPHTVATMVSASASRLLLMPGQQALSVQVLKQRGQWGGQQCQLRFATHHLLMPQLPVWQWPVARANLHQQSADTVTQHEDDDRAPPLTDGVIRGGHG